MTGTLTDDAQFADTAVFAESSASFLAKYDAEGTLLWVSLATGLCAARSVAVLLDGSAYVVGAFRGSCTFPTSPAATALMARGSTDLFVAKYASDGVLDWVSAAGGFEFDSANAVVASGDGAAYVTGSYVGGATFGSLTAPALPGNENAFLARYRPDGSVEWVQHGGGEVGVFARGNALALGRDGAIYAAGQFGQSGKPVVEAMFGDKSIAGSESVYLAKYLPDGTVDWVTGLIAEGRWAIALGVAVSEQDESYVTGGLMVTYPGTYRVTAYETLLVKFDAAGELMWDELASSSGGQYRSSFGRGIALSACSVHLVGDFNDDWLFVQSALQSAGHEDLFVCRMGRTR